MEKQNTATTAAQLDGIVTRFWPRDCRACGGDGCEHCDNGVFEAALKPGWQMPEQPDGCKAIAVLDVDYWCYLGFMDREMNEVCEIEWPFIGTWADAEDFHRLGFRVENT